MVVSISMCQHISGMYWARKVLTCAMFIHVNCAYIWLRSDLDLYWSVKAHKFMFVRVNCHNIE